MSYNFGGFMETLEKFKIIRNDLLETLALMQEAQINVKNPEVFNKVVKMIKDVENALGMDSYSIDEDTVESNEGQQQKYIITEDGLFYTNYSDRFKAGLATIPESENYSEYLVYLRENYGIKIGKPQYNSNVDIPKNDMSVGVYIVDCSRYLKDIQQSSSNLENIKIGKSK